MLMADQPTDFRAGGVYRPGDEIYWFARFHKAVTVSGRRC